MRKQALLKQSTAFIWLGALGVGPFAAPAYAHAETMLVGIAIWGALIHSGSVVFLLLVKGKPRDKVRAIAAYALIVGAGALLVLLTHGAGALSSLGSWVYGLGTLFGPLLAYAWISDGS